jgi:hypothetical protein
LFTTCSCVTGVCASISFQSSRKNNGAFDWAGQRKYPAEHNAIGKRNFNKFMMSWILDPRCLTLRSKLTKEHDRNDAG